MFDIIFDTLFDFFSAWDVMGLLFMGAVFILIGGLFIGYDIYWRLKSEKVDGIISAVKEQGKYYYSVFKYKTKDGQTFEQDGTLGSSSLLNQLPGTEVKIMIMPNNPEKVRRPTLIWLLFGSIFFGPGLFIMNLAIKKFEFNYMIALFLLAAAIFGGEKLFKLYKKVTRTEFDRALIKETWQDIKKGKKPTSKTYDKKRRVLEKSEILKKAKDHLKYRKISILLLFLCVIGFSGGSYYTGQNMIDLKQNGLVTNGTVNAFKSDYSSDTGGYTYYASVKFIAINGKEYQFFDDFSSSTRLFTVGETVDILYNPKSPESAIIDRGILNWGITAGLLIMALLSLWGIYSTMTAQKRFRNTKFMQNY